MHLPITLPTSYRALQKLTSDLLATVDQDHIFLETGLPCASSLAMAAQVPAALKAADITRFAHRAAQLEKPKPIVAYWCIQLP